MAFSRILVSGVSGLLGPYLQKAAEEWGHVLTTSRTGGNFPADLLDAGETKALIDRAAPDIVVHAAALTDVDVCEKEPDLAFRFNVDATENISRCLQPESRLVFISTDQIYPDTPGPHPEELEGPVNTYGRSKLAGERAALSHSNGLVLRTNFFGPSCTPGRHSLSDFFIKHLRARKKVTMFSDVFFSPLHMNTLCDLIFRSVSEGLQGVYNLGCRAGMSKAEFGLSVARQMGLGTETAVLGSEQLLPGRARRPSDMRMDVDKIETALHTSMPTLEEEIAKL